MTTPSVVITSSTPATLTSRTRRSITPVIDIEHLIAEKSDITLPYISAQSVNLFSPQSHYDNQWQENLEKQGEQIQSILVKQGKQLRALYEMQKSTNEQIAWIVNQVKQQSNKDSNDLNPKVFMVSNFIF